MLAFLRFLALAATCCLASCIDGHEEIWIHPDGSGRAEVHYTLPAAAANLQGGEDAIRQKLADFIEKNRVFTSSHFEVTTVEKQLHIRVEVAFKSALDLKNITSGSALKKLPSSASHLAGKVKVALHGRFVDFSRTLSPGAALPGSGFMPASQFENRRLTYIIHLPTAATQSNATQITDSGRTLTWDFPLAEAIQQPITTQFTAPIPIPRWLFPSLAALLLLALCFIVRKIRRTRRAKEFLIKN